MGNSRNFIDPTLRIQISVVLNEYATFNCSHTAKSARIPALVPGILTLCVRVGVHPSVVSRVSDIVGVIVDSSATFVVHIPRLDRHDITVIVVRKQDRD